MYEVDTDEWRRRGVHESADPSDYGVKSSCRRSAWRKLVLTRSDLRGAHCERRCVGGKSTPPDHGVQSEP